jgi:cob(I)alamin adenosyltransferase
LALRAVGAGLSVYYLRLMKPRWKTGERLVLPHLGARLVFRNVAQDWSLRRSGNIPEHKESMRLALAREMDRLERVLKSGDYDLVVADELIYCVHKGLVPMERVLSLCEVRPQRVEFVLTGRGAPSALVACADLVTEMRAVKHYMQAGLPARRGIEF